MPAREVCTRADRFSSVFGIVKDLITICIPTYRRPTFLLHCVYSCLAQDYRPLEIDISDNSPNPETGEWVQTVPPPEGVSIRYWRNPPSTSQVESFRKLIDAARGRRLVFMNDDDVLLPGAVTAMSEAFEMAPDVIVSYGREQRINAEGEILHETTARWEIKYRRTSDQTGLRRDLLVCAFWQQISHVGFLVLTDAARRVGFRDRSEVGLAVDTDFAIRLAQAYRGYAHVLIDRFTTQSRIGPSRLGQTSRDVAWKLYDNLSDMGNLSQEEALARDCLLRRFQPLAFREHSLAHGRLAALRLFLSRPYNASGDLARWVYTLSLVISPNLAWWMRHACVRPWARAKDGFAGSYGHSR
jgi:glycosyltransferase involved in cell wall biosynthesis